MYRMLSIVMCLIVCAAVAVAQDSTKEKPKPEDFIGKWSGKWDNVYTVRFTIERDKMKKLSYVYEWEESLGKSLQMQRGTGEIVGNVLQVGKKIEISIFDKEPDKGKAVGNFAKKRIANLLREKD